MRPTVEKALAAIGAAVCIGGAIAVWQWQSSSNSPGETLWPLPAVALIEMFVLGITGLAVLTLDRGKASSLGSIVRWVVCGGLVTLLIIGAFSIGPIVLPAVLIFGGAAILAPK